MKGGYHTAVFALELNKWVVFELQFQTKKFTFASIQSRMRLVISNHSFEIEDMNVTFTIVVLESNTICPVPIKSIHGYQGVDIS